MRRAAVALALLAVGMSAAPAAAAGRCGNHPWCDTSLSAEKRADLLLRALTPSERVGLLGGDEVTGAAGFGPTGTSLGVGRVGLPDIFFSDGPVGPRQGKATAFPAPMSLAASWSPALARLAGTTIAEEVKHKGSDVVFAPTVNILRTPLWGRSFETYGEDPYLSGRLGVDWIKGAQSTGVIANVKHYAVNNQEGKGGLFILGGTQGGRLFVDAKLDERTLREIYLPQFEMAVKQGRVGSVMCAYNRVNGAYACQHRRLLEGILRDEWGFRGFTLADYGGAHDTPASLRGGLDFEPWPPIAYQPLLITAALATGVKQSFVDQHVHRILRTLFAYGALDRPAFPRDDAIDRGAHALAARRVEEAGITLLKNDGLLPLDSGRTRSIAVIGAEANTFKSGGGSSAVKPYEFSTVWGGISHRAGPGVQVRYDPGTDHAAAAATARGADVAIVVAGDTQAEGGDKDCLALDCARRGSAKDALIDAVIAANPNTAVVLLTGGPVLTPWRHRARAVVEAWYPGQQGGDAVARVLFGDVDPGGRLPATFPAEPGDEPSAGDPAAYPGTTTVRYKEGVLVGYRWYDRRGIAPAYPFGHGLSYTRFSMRRLAATAARDGSIGATVGIDVRNTGRRAGTAVAQLYLGMPSPRAGVVQPPRQLKGFSRTTLAPGRTKRLRMRLDRRSFSYWDTRSDSWQVARGCYELMVGTSSRAIARRGTVAVGGARCSGAIASIPGRQPRCTRRASAVVRLRGIPRRRVKSVLVKVNGKRRARLVGPRRGVRVRTPAGRRARTFRIRVLVRTRADRVLVRKRTVRRCARAKARVRRPAAR